MIRVLIADDHPVVRAGLRALLAAEPDVEVVADVDSAEAAIAYAATESVDLVLMDLRFGTGVGGAEATKRIRAAAHPPEVLVVTNYDTDADILGAIEAGAAGYLLKDAPPTELLAAVRTAAAGESVLSPTVATRLVTRVRNPATNLTPRETEVLALVADGKSNRDIGKALFLSETTVKSHLVHIFTKLGVKSRISAVAKAREQGVL